MTTSTETADNGRSCDPLLRRSLRVRLDDAALVPDLIGFFGRMGFSAEADRTGAIEIVPLNAVSDVYDRMTTEAYLKTWLDAHRTAYVTAGASDEDER